MGACKQVAAGGSCVPSVTLRAVMCLVGGLAALAPAPALGDLGRLVRGIARVSDDVPVRRIDDVARSPGMRRTVREVLENAGTHVDDIVDRTKAVRKMLDDALSSIGSQPLRQQLRNDLKGLDLLHQEAAMVLARGSKPGRRST